MSSVFQGSYRPYICDSTVNVSTTNQTTSPTGFERLIQAVAPNAFHNSDDRPDPPKCHENTRVAVINKIMDWVTGKIDTDALMLWLYGPAGAGKSAIARTIAELCAAHGLLLASFLFFRSDPKRNTMKPLVANIAYRVGCVIPGAREPINTAIETDPLILSYSVEAQLTSLVLEPLQLLDDQGHFLHRPFPRLVIIDGLDECLDQDAQTNLIRLLSSSAARYQLQLKFLIASRPEAHIKSAVALASDKSTISRLELNNDFKPDEDIRRFLTDKFHEIKMCHPLRSQIPSSWPGECKINELVRKASGQFIYASLAARFVNCPGLSPTTRLDIVLELRPPIHHDLPFAELDALYTYILSCSYDPDLVRRILGVDDAFVGVTIGDIDGIEAVLGLEHGDVRVYLSALSSILEVESSGPRFDQIVFHHSSFMDFLHTSERSKDYFVDAREINALIAQWIMEGFPRNECSVSQRGAFIVGLEECLPKALWTVELKHALENFSFGDYVDDFMNTSGDYSILDLTIKEFFGYLETEKPEFLRHHSVSYLEHVMSSIESHPSAEKFHLLSTVWFVLQQPCKSHLSCPEAMWGKLCTTLFGFNSTDTDWDWHFHYLMRHPKDYNSVRDTLKPLQAIYGHIAKTTRLVPQPIFSHRLARVAISCIQYLCRRGLHTPPTQDDLRAWAIKSKRLPWMWRRRMQVIAARREMKHKWREQYSFPLSLRRLRRILHCKGIQSEQVYKKAHIMYMWTLDLLYRTLLKARKDDELTKALSESFIHWPAPILFPRHVKRVRKAIDTYLEEARRRDYWSVVL